MKKRIIRWQIAGFIAASIFGTLLHYLYDWLQEATWIAPFSGVNESTWEHMKLLFWAMLAFSIIQSRFFSERRDFWCVKLRGILLGITLIPIIFYTYNGVIGKSPDWLNISIFFICAAISYIYETRLFISDKIICKTQKSSIMILCLIALLFIVFTFITPEIGIFRDPLTGKYGI